MPGTHFLKNFEPSVSVSTYTLFTQLCRHLCCTSRSFERHSVLYIQRSVVPQAIETSDRVIAFKSSESLLHCLRHPVISKAALNQPQKVTHHSRLPLVCCSHIIAIFHPSPLDHFAIPSPPIHHHWPPPAQNTPQLSQLSVAHCHLDSPYAG
jgi:hypothetical protein